MFILLLFETTNTTIVFFFNFCSKLQTSQILQTLKHEYCITHSHDYSYSVINIHQKLQACFVLVVRISRKFGKLYEKSLKIRSMLKPELKYFFTVSCSLLPLLLYVTLFFNIISPEHFFSFCGTSTSRKKNKFKPDFQNFQVEAGASDFSRKKIFEFVIDHSKRYIKNITKCLTNFFFSMFCI